VAVVGGVKEREARAGIVGRKLAGECELEMYERRPRGL
jgi:hypothetical protein